ncbi:MAG: hypothetical protein M1404_05175 [Acidobacteria bacterium]|nr:hypothetical protein [Acidobacteriota bacterium]
MEHRRTVGRRRFLKYSGGGVLAIASGLHIPDAWGAPAAEVDYAESRYVDLWLRHPVYGDPSFDAFERLPGNPIFTGSPPYGWPVNGFFFPDPASGNWYIYIGDYPVGYVGPPPSRCILYRSKNRGQTWENLGPVLHGDAEMFDKNGQTPDVSVVFAHGRYRMVYDWGQPNPLKDGGLAYAWADKPEGPWHRDMQPITRNLILKPLLGRYQRTYAGTLVRRKNDWLILAMMDHAPFSWAMFAMSAPNPQGPYSERVLIRNVEAGYFHPPLMEGYPAFVDAGYVYAPATSVARNRNFQVIFRAPLEMATDPKAWEIFRYGSAWHSEGVPNESYGIWGQTFSGWVDQRGVLRVMFPSRNTKGYGTINLAERPWLEALRKRGFHFSGDRAPSLTCLRRGYSDFTLNTELRVRGKAQIIWGYGAPLGPNRPTSDATLHPLSLTRYQGVELAPNGWRVITVDGQGSVQVRATGAVQPRKTWKVMVAREANGSTMLALDGKEIWRGRLSIEGNLIGLLAELHSHVFVARFAITGKPEPSTLPFLYTEAWLGAGENPADWLEQKDSAFRFGTGAVRRDGAGRAKWNFIGSGFTLWSPKGPDYGTVVVELDDHVLGTTNLHSAEMVPSQPVFLKTGLADTFHAVTLWPKTGRLVVDGLEVHNSMPRHL